MDIQSNLTKGIGIIFGVALLMTALPQIALAYSCTTTLLVINAGCADGSFVLDTQENIATDSPFGISDWVVLDTSNDGADDGVAGIGLVTRETKIPHLGIWRILSDGQNPWDIYDDMMITLQSASGDYVAYSLRQNARRGLYFIYPHEPSLIQARLWGTIATVPLPLSVWLFGSGLIGLVTIATRRKAV